jgi:D-ribose pyranase
MRADGLWHPRLLAIVADLGHTDRLVIADAGLPVPRGVESIDLRWARGEPGFLPVLRAVLGEFVVEHATAAQEASEEVLSALRDVLGPAVPLSTVPHDGLKELTHSAAAVVRTGEATPYANVVLTAGVPF